MWTVIWQDSSAHIHATYVLAPTPENAALVAESGVSDDRWDGVIAVIQGHLVEMYIDRSGNGKLSKWH